MHRYFFFSLMLILSNVIFAANQPANFDDTENSLLAELNFPAIKGNASALINCSGIIKKNRKIDHIVCYKNQAGDEIYIQEIYRASKKSRFNPAKINSKVVEVFIQFRILFKQEKDNSSVKLLSNAGYEENVNAYGMSYIGAQRVIGNESWQNNCPKYNRYRVLSKAHVDITGAASNANITPLNGIDINKKCNISINSSINSSRYIPAHNNSKPVPSTYIELFGN
jgi:hypothetical protein